MFKPTSGGTQNKNTNQLTVIIYHLRKISEQQLQLTAKVDRLAAEANSIKNEVASIKAKVCGELQDDRLSAENFSIKNEMASIEAEMCGLAADPLSILHKPRVRLPMAPFKTLDQLLSFEDKCKEEHALKDFVKEVMECTEKTYDKFIRQTWRKLMTDDVAKQCCWRGTNNKKCVRGLQITFGIRTAFKQKFHMEDADFDRTTKKFFQYAQDRVLKSQKATSIRKKA